MGNWGWGGGRRRVAEGCGGGAPSVGLPLRQVERAGGALIYNIVSDQIISYHDILVSDK